jgi:predicted SAM-dependent methyltransferase
MLFSDIKNNDKIYLYCGDMYMKMLEYTTIPFIGLSLTQSNNNHIKHDITNKFDLLDNSVDIVQSEDVMEHIDYNQLPDIINEIYRVLKVGGLFRLSLPDYRCDILSNRSLKNKSGDIYFDAGGGGDYDYINKKVIHGGHLWFPKYEEVKKLLDDSNFNKDNNTIEFLHYYDNDNDNHGHINTIDYSLGYVHRTPDFDKRVQIPKRPMSLVIDCWKK